MTPHDHGRDVQPAAPTVKLTWWDGAVSRTVCPAINAYRQSLVDGNPIPPPAPNQDCPDSPATGSFFGNTDIFGGSYADPTTP